MLKRVRFVLVSTVLAVLCVAAPAAAEECVELQDVQFKHCI